MTAEATLDEMKASRTRHETTMAEINANIRRFRDRSNRQDMLSLVIRSSLEGQKSMLQRLTEKSQAAADETSDSSDTTAESKEAAAASTGTSASGE